MLAEPRSARIVAVVPTIDADNLQRALPWLTALRDAGIVPVVAANSAATAELPLPEGFLRSTDGSNGGFARSVNRGARDAGGWDWIVMLNDDLLLEQDGVQALASAVRAQDARRPALLLFDPEAPRTIPSRAETLIGLSLLGEIPGRLARNGSHLDAGPDGPLPPGQFKSFSAAAISRSAWEEVGPLSEQFLFCYEDADWSRRFGRAGGTAIAVSVPIRHNRSKSTKSRIRTVLPAIAESATAYLVSSGVPASMARALVAVALVVRVPLILGASAPRIQHLRGIGAALRLAVSSGTASLPPFGEPVGDAGRQRRVTRKSS